MEDNAVLRFDHVSLRFPDRQEPGTYFTAIDGIDIGIKEGEFVSVVGPSGCGKSTLLNLAAGLLKPTKGGVSYRGNAITTVNRNVGYITQQDNLLPWQTTQKNVELALRIRNVPPKDRRDIARKWIELVGLKGFEDNYPRELSGGMRKRAAIARTLCYDPDTILLDEPFGALDAQLRVVMQDELMRIWQESGKKTVLFITHDLSEAVALSDRVIVLSARPGRIVAEYNIPLPRPRSIRELRFSETFNKLHEQLWKSIETNLGA